MKLTRFLGALLCVSLFFSFNGSVVVACCHDGGMTKQDSCKYCGMDREKFAHCRMLVEYDDGTSVGTCSIHCMAVELANNIDKMPTSVKVGDFNTRKMIDAETAFWVVGGDKSGVMSSRAKWAFEKKADADSFIKTNNGAPVNFDDAIRSAYEDMYKDTKMIRDRRKMKRMKQMEHN